MTLRTNADRTLWDSEDPSLEPSGGDCSLEPSAADETRDPAGDRTEPCMEDCVPPVPGLGSPGVGVGGLLPCCDGSCTYTGLVRPSVGDCGLEPPVISPALSLSLLPGLTLPAPDALLPCLLSSSVAAK